MLTNVLRTCAALVPGSAGLWNVETGKELQRFVAHFGGVRIVVFSPDGRFALSGGIFDGMVKLWRLPPVE